MHRCFQAADLQSGQLVLSRDESHHLCRVLRARVGSEVTVINGVGCLASGHLSYYHDGHAVIDISEVTHVARPQQQLTLIQAAVTNNNNDNIVRAATAIGVAEIIFVETDNCECKLKNKVDNKLPRWTTIAIETCKQSGNPFLPKIHYARSLSAIDMTKFDTKVFGGLSDHARAITSLQIKGHTGVAIGPEGDFSASEYCYFREEGFMECRLSRYTLRSEMAAMYIMSVLDYLTQL